MAENDNSNAKWIAATVVIILITCGVIAYLINKINKAESDMNDMVELMNYEKDQLEDEYADMALELEGVSMKINNDSILSLLDQEQKRVQTLLEELRTVKATNARRITELKQELASVRKVLVYYVAQVDSLSAENQRLEQENETVQRQFRAATAEVETLSAEKEQLVEKVTIASQLEARDITVETQNERGRKTKSVKRVAVIKVLYNIGKNITSEVGEKTIYMRISAPDGMILQKNHTDMFMFEDSEIAFSSSKDFEYSGEDMSDVIYYTITETLWPGEYRIDLFVDAHLIGSQTFTLTK